MTLALMAATLVVIDPKPKSTPTTDERSDPLAGIVYYKHPTTGKLALYVAYELEPFHTYSYQVTDDGVTWTEIRKRTIGATEIYESFNVPDPCNGIWPRLIDLGVQ